MVKWGPRTALAFALTMMFGLLATSIAPGASASYGDPSFEMNATASIVGDGSEVYVTGSGCTAGGAVGIWIDRYPFDQVLADQTGAFSATIDVPDWLLVHLPLEEAKAYCYNTGNEVYVDIDANTDGDPGDGDPGNGDPGNGDPGNGDPGNGDPGNGDGGQTGVGDEFYTNPGCYLIYDISGFNISGDTMIADQDYDVVALWINTWGPDATVYYDVKAGQTLKTATGLPILKISVCNPKGTPGYTPGDLPVDAQFDASGTNVLYTVIGCPTGSTVELYFDDFAWQDTVLVQAGDQISGSLPIKGATPTFFKAICQDGSYGLTGISGASGGSNGGPVDVDDPTEPTVTPTVTPTNDGTDNDGRRNGRGGRDRARRAHNPDRVLRARLIDEVSQARAGHFERVAARQSFDLPAFGEEVEAGDAGDESAEAASPALRATGNATSAAKSATGGFPAAQAGFGVLSGAGLLAFIGLRKVSRSMAYKPEHTE